MGDGTFRGWPHHLPDLVSEAVAVADERGVLTGWSQGAHQLLGLPAEEAVGRPAAELLAEGARQRHGIAAYTAAGGGPAVLRPERRLRRALARRGLRHRRDEADPRASDRRCGAAGGPYPGAGRGPVGRLGAARRALGRPPGPRRGDAPARRVEAGPI
ncbi:PAS domain-containing protein [Streptomyces sp. NPDC005393]|uniref:PAS domain-containing protein n=1 Tax=Streptomyces sp. NPDC005393 TaxID=3157041 RepID=UPI0033A34C41